MLGLRTQESEKFNVFWEIIQKTAQKSNSTFFGDCGEGRDFETSDMEGEDFSGWLIPNDKVADFEKEFIERKISDKWSDFITFAIWKEKDNGISVEFRQF